MTGFLQQHAYANVWCTPNQDMQSIFQPQRISPNGGAWIDFKVMWRTISLPDKKSRFAIYQIGQIGPMLLGLTDQFDTWVKASDAMIADALMMDIYAVDGVQIHRTQVWYRRTRDQDLIIAIRQPEFIKIPIDLDTDTIYIRFYSNAFFKSTRANSADDVIYVEGIQAITTQDILDMQNHIATYRSKAGYVTCYLNGFRVDTIDLTNSVTGDYIEFVFDGSVKRVVTFNVRDLKQFTSILDNTSKYLLHYPGNVGVIEYQDDVDFYLVRPGTNAGRYKGLYYHKNSPAAVRMVTHQDYSLNVQFLAAYATAHPELGSVDDMQVIVQIRNSGYDRPLVDDYNHIKDLYLLADTDLIGAMVGINATVDVWKAANLENSDYCAIMRANYGTVSTEQVQDAYGYNAVSKLIADTPQATVFQSSAQRVTLPGGLSDRCTVYEYDANGFLLGYYQHTTGTAYQCVNNNAATVEAISGLGQMGLQSYWNIPTHSIDLSINHRFYVCGQNAGLPDYNWVDVTGSSWYSIINGVVTWLVDHTTQYTLVRRNQDHLVYSLSYAAVDSLITFSIAEYREDLAANRTMTLPMGELDIFLNGKSLIEKIDYIVDFPRVTIINKAYLVNPDSTNQAIVIRFCNFCNSDLSRNLPADVGFVQYGALSFNNRYDIRDDKVNRVIVEGALFRFDELEFAEGDFDIHVTGATNGFPYSIGDIIVPMNPYLAVETDQKVDPTYTLRARDKIVTDAISQYMTLKIPEKVPADPSAIAALYPVVSPFFSRIVYDLNSGALWDDAFTEQYSDDFVRTTVERYEYLLAWDPITDVNFLSPNFVVVQPHNLNHYVDMGIYQFKFLTRVQRIYAPTRISLSGSIRVIQF